MCRLYSWEFGRANRHARGLIRLEAEDPVALNREAMVAASYGIVIPSVTVMTFCLWSAAIVSP